MLNHTFVICAYKESPYLEKCIQSIKKQHRPSEVILSTSTPSPFLTEMSRKYGLRLVVNEGEKGITQDWNFALSLVKTKYATIAHQDDVYSEQYTDYMIQFMETKRRPLIGFSDYCEIHNGKIIRDTGMLRIKRLMLWPLKWKVFADNRFARRRILSMGCPICCPSVCYNLELIERPVFQNRYLSNEDWEAWEIISKAKGTFVYVSRILVAHRIHADSTTTEALKDDTRMKECEEMFCKFWPKPIAKLINKWYSRAEQYNKV